MIFDIALAIGRFVDRLLGHDRPALSSAAAWRAPLQLPAEDAGPAYTGGVVPPGLYGDANDGPETVVLLTAEDATELAERDALRQSVPRRRD